MHIERKNHDYTKIDSIDINDLVDITQIVIDTSQPIPDRKRSYIHQIKNPLLFRCGETKVRVSYGTENLEERIREYLLSRSGTALI